MPTATSSTSVLAGARDVNAMHLIAAYQDLGGKITFLLSFANMATSALSGLTAAVSALNAAAVSTAGSGVTFSAFSTAPSALVALGSYTGLYPNFTAT